MVSPSGFWGLAQKLRLMGLVTLGIWDRTGAVIKAMSLALTNGSFTTLLPGKPSYYF